MGHFFLNVQLVDKILLMAGFELRISGVGSDRSTNLFTLLAYIMDGSG